MDAILFLLKAIYYYEEAHNSNPSNVVLIEKGSKPIGLLPLN